MRTLLMTATDEHDDPKLTPKTSGVFVKPFIIEIENISAGCLRLLLLALDLFYSTTLLLVLSLALGLPGLA